MLASRAARTRFEWAYPSGVEDAHGLAPQQWIAGSTMVLATVIMNALYLAVETRTKVGERGINDPPIKLAVTMITYFFLWMLQALAWIDPSKTSQDQINEEAMPRPTHCTDTPLHHVCIPSAPTPMHQYQYQGGLH